MAVKKISFLIPLKKIETINSSSPSDIYEC